MPDYLSLFQLVGGLGVFPLGMIAMTDALRALEANCLIRRVANHIAQIVEQLQAAAG
jgi:hypothetical protein